MATAEAAASEERRPRHGVGAAHARAEALARRKRLVESVREFELGATEQREIFNLLTSAGAEYSKNVNGCFFDITAVPDAVIERIEGFIRFCCDSNLILDAAYPKLAAAAAPTTPERAAAGVAAAEAKEARDAEHAVHTVLQETLAKARADALATRRRETSRYLQLRKRFSRASAKAQNYPDLLQYE